MENQNRLKCLTRRSGFGAMRGRRVFNSPISSAFPLKFREDKPRETACFLDLDGIGSGEKRYVFLTVRCPFSRLNYVFGTGVLKSEWGCGVRACRRLDGGEHFEFEAAEWQFESSFLFLASSMSLSSEMVFFMFHFSGSA